MADRRSAIFVCNDPVIRGKLKGLHERECEDCQSAGRRPARSGGVGMIIDEPGYEKITRFIAFCPRCGISVRAFFFPGESRSLGCFTNGLPCRPCRNAE